MAGRITVCLIIMAGCVCVWGDQSALKVLPFDTVLVYSVNVKKADETKTTDMFARPGLKELEYFRDTTGIDLEEDTNYVTVGMKMEQGGTKSLFYTVLKGSFSLDGFTAELKKTANPPPGDQVGGKALFAQEEHMDTTVWVFTEKGLCVSIIDKHTLISGTEACVQEMIEIDKRKAKAASANKTLMPLIPRADRRSVIWGAFRNDVEKAEKKDDGGIHFSVLMQRRRWRRPGDRLRRLIREAEDLTGDEFKRISELDKQLCGYKALGIENKVLSKIQRSGAAVPCIFFTMHLEYSDSKEADSVCQNIKQVQNFMKTAAFQEIPSRMREQALIINMMEGAKAVSAGSIVKLIFTCEQKKYDILRKEFAERFLKGFQKGLEQKYKQAPTKKKREVKVIKSDIPF